MVFRQGHAMLAENDLSGRRMMHRFAWVILVVGVMSFGFVDAGGDRGKFADVPLPKDLVAPDTVAVAGATVAFLEGPAADAVGNVFFSDIAGNRIMKLDAKGNVSVFRADSG